MKKSQKLKLSEKGHAIQQECSPSAKIRNKASKKKIVEGLKKKNGKNRNKTISLISNGTSGNKKENKMQVILQPAVKTQKNNHKKKMLLKKSNPKKKVHEETHYTGNFLIER